MSPRTHTTWRGLWSVGDWPGSSAGSTGQVGRSMALRSSPAPPGWLLLPASPDLPSLPLMPPGPTQPGWGVGAGVPAWELSSLPGRVGQMIALRSSPALPGESLPPASPDLPGLRDADPVWTPLLLPLQSPYILLVHFGVPPVSLGIRVPTSGRQAP